MSKGRQASAADTWLSACVPAAARNEEWGEQKCRGDRVFSVHATPHPSLSGGCCFSNGVDLVEVSDDCTFIFYVWCNLIARIKVGSGVVLIAKSRVGGLATPPCTGVYKRDASREQAYLLTNEGGLFARSPPKSLPR